MCVCVARLATSFSPLLSVARGRVHEPPPPSPSSSSQTAFESGWDSQPVTHVRLSSFQRPFSFRRRLPLLCHYIAQSVHSNVRHVSSNCSATCQGIAHHRLRSASESVYCTCFRLSLFTRIQSSAYRVAIPKDQSYTSLVYRILGNKTSRLQQSILLRMWKTPPPVRPLRAPGARTAAPTALTVSPGSHETENRG